MGKITKFDRVVMKIVDVIGYVCVAVLAAMLSGGVVGGLMYMVHVLQGKVSV